MKLFNFLLLLTLSVSIFACKKNCETDPDPQNPVFNASPLRFDSLAVGQGARYAGLIGENYPSSTENVFHYTKDTLWWEIVGADGNGFLVKESLIYDQEPESVWFKPDKDSVYYFYIKVENDTLHFRKKNSSFFYSRLIGYHIGRSGLPLASYTNQEIKIEGWKTNLNYCECSRTGYTENYELFGKTYPLLNVMVENSPMALDGNGETYVYSRKEGIVRYSTYSWWTQDGICWDLIP